MPQIVWVILVIVLVLAIFGGLPATGWHSYGYAPSGLGLVLLIVLLVVIFR